MLSIDRLLNSFCCLVNFVVGVGKSSVFSCECCFVFVLVRVFLLLVEIVVSLVCIE